MTHPWQQLGISRAAWYRQGRPETTDASLTPETTAETTAALTGDLVALAVEQARLSAADADPHRRLDLQLEQLRPSQRKLYEAAYLHQLDTLAGVYRPEPFR